MKKYKLGKMEQKFADLIWQTAPVSTRDLITLCSESFDWKQTTTYTMFKRLCNRELFETNKGLVKIILSKENFLTEKGEEFLEKTFNRSLPKFIIAFTRHKKLTNKDVLEIQQLIDDYKED
jgi:predicted transcriptional regulator